MSIRIVVADDHDISRTGMIAALRRDPDLQVIAEAANGTQTIACCRELGPALLILALRRSAAASLTVVRALSREGCPPRMLLLGERADPLAIQAALDAGAGGYLLASASLEEILAAVYRVHAGRRVVPRLDGAAPSTPSSLCPRERLILGQVARGLPSKAIARQQGISERTVSNHLQQAFRKLGASNRVEAIVRARECGILPGD
jgi:DNA-binding NarL/FixJ family response regulator